MPDVDVFPETTSCGLEGGGCKSDDRVYGVYNPVTKRMHRLTFSKSLADMLANNSGLSVQRWSFWTGQKLKNNEPSKNGLYAVCDVESGLVLRISMHCEIASMYACDSSRELREVWLKPIANKDGS